MNVIFCQQNFGAHFYKVTLYNKLGCVADLIDPLKEVCQENSKSDECRTCIGSNCNKKQTFARCLHCDSALDPQCAINPQPSSLSKVCSAYEDECYTYISKFNVSRGCVAEQKPDFRTEECRNPQKCTICPATDRLDCNNRAIVMETCVDCDTKNGENCYDDLNTFKGKVCSDIDSKEKEGCYLSIVSQIDRFSKISPFFLSFYSVGKIRIHKNHRYRIFRFYINAIERKT